MLAEVKDPCSRFPVQNWCGLTSHRPRNVPPNSPSWPTPPGGVRYSGTISCLSRCLWIWFPGYISEGHQNLQFLGISRRPGNSVFKHPSFLSEDKVRIQRESPWQFPFSWFCSCCHGPLWCEPNTNKTPLAKYHMALQARKKILHWKRRSPCVPGACCVPAGAFHLANLICVTYSRISPYLSGRDNLFILREDKHTSTAQMCAK